MFCLRRLYTRAWRAAWARKRTEAVLSVAAIPSRFRNPNPVTEFAERLLAAAVAAMDADTNLQSAELGIIM